MSLRGVERALITRILGELPALCHDCGSVAFRVERGSERPVVAVYHLASCPALRSAWSARACDDYVRAVLILGGLHLAEYGDGEVAHRRARAEA